MKHSWKEVKIGDIAFQDKKSAVAIELDKVYPMVGVFSYGKGLFHKEDLIGINTSYKTFNRLNSEHIILSQLFGWEGAIALSSEEFADKYVSSQFPTFLVNEQFALRNYVGYYLQQTKVWKKLFEVGIGMGSRRRTLNPSNLLNLSIPLPPLSEQQQIVSKIGGIKTKLNRIKDLQAEQEKELNNLLFSKYTEIIKDAHWLSMKEVAPIFRRKVELNPDETYLEIGVRSFGRGLFEKPSFKGAELSWQQPYWVKEGDLLFSNIKAWEGAVGLIPKQYDGWVGSHRYLTCLPNLDILNPEFIYYYFRTYEGVEKLSSASPGTVDRNRTLNTKMLGSMLVPVPSLELQKEFVALLEKVNTIKQHHTQTNQELTELMPSLLDKAFKGELTYSKQEDSQLLAAEPMSNYQPKAKSLIPENKKSFAKQVLGGKIVSLFKDDKNFTHIKFQKLQYIAEHVIEEDLNWNYYRQTAGPYDNKFMHSVIYNLSRNKWFEENDYKFYPLAKASEIDKYYQTYFGDKNDKLNKLFCLLKNATEKFCEAVATIYAVWNNHIIQKVEFDLEKIRQDFFAWSNRKENLFSNEEFELALQWMQKNSIEPTGFGQVIKERK